MGGTVSSDPHKVTVRASHVRIRAEDGVADPPRIVPVGATVRLKAAVDGGGAGSFSWSTTSRAITLANETTDTVSVTGGAQPSSGRDAETLQLVFTPSGGTAEPAVTARLTVIKVTFEASPTQKY